MLLCVLIVQCLGAFSVTAETRAGTLITNIAKAQVKAEEGEWTLTSNPVTFSVAERLDVALVRANDNAIAVSAGGVAVPVTLTNRGNGQEAFDLAATPSDATARVRLIAIDRDGDGRFDAAIDTPLVDGRTPALEPGERLALLVVVDPAAIDVTVTELVVDARAVTGSGPEATLFEERGDGGVDALTGSTEARAQVSVPIGAEGAAGPVLFKSQSVRAPDGSTIPVVGAIITYRLEARFPGPTAGVSIADPIPQGTAYVPGSLTLDAVRLSDGADADAGTADDAGIAVTLGDIAAAATRTVQFQVIIQ